MAYSATPRGRPIRGKLVEAVVVVVAMAAFATVVAPTLDQPLLERHSFRQTQTAYTARIFHEEGIDLLHPKLPVLGEPFEVPFEFPLFQAAAALVMDAGADDDLAMRLTGLLCFLLTGGLIYGLVRYVADPVSGVAALVAFLATPFALLWGRSSMIEYLATAGAVGFAWATIAWRQNRRPAVAGLALAAGLVGMLVKPTTAVFWIIPALAYRPVGSRPGDGRRGVAVLMALVLIPIAAAALWTRHADAIKAASPTTAWLTSSHLDDWSFGTLAQRLDPGVWGVIVDRVMRYVVGLGGVALLGVALVTAFRSSQRRFWLGIAVTAVLPPVVFTNLYFEHDYYLAAITPALAALMGLGAGFLWRLLRQRPSALWAAVFGTLLLASSTIVFGHGYWHKAVGAGPDYWMLSLAREVDARTTRDDRIGVVGLEWSPAVLYYADRRGLMVVERNADITYDILKRDDYRHVVVIEPNDEILPPLTRWRWTSALAPHVYGVADMPGDLPGSTFVASDDVGLARSRMLHRGLRVRCGEPMKISSGKRWTLIMPTNATPRTKVKVSEELAPLPARRAIFVDPALSHAGELTFTCSGQESLTLGVSDAPDPLRP